jgi:predicted ATP-grasp superfamily ATP-dependent carboligase
MKTKLDIIKETVSEYYDIPIKLMEIKCRKSEIVKCRFFIFKYSKHYIKYSFARAGMIFGQDPRTAMNGINTINNLIDTEVQYYQANQFMESEIEKQIKNIIEIDNKIRAAEKESREVFLKTIELVKINSTIKKNISKRIAKARQDRSLMYRSGIKR